MPITYQSTRIQSAQAVELMRRINALEDNAYSLVNREIIGLDSNGEQIEGASTSITCDLTGGLYVYNPQGTTAGVDPIISKFDYNGNIVDIDFIRYGAGVQGDGYLKSGIMMDADDEALWVVNFRSSTDASIKKFSIINGSESLEITRSATLPSLIDAGFDDVQVRPDGSIYALYKEQSIIGLVRTKLYLLKYDADGTNETEVYSVAYGSTVVASIHNLVVNTTGDAIFSITATGSGTTAYRYNSNGTLLDTIPDDGSGGFSRANNFFVGNKIITSTGLVSNGVLRESYYQQDGTFIESVDLSTNVLGDANDSTEDQSGNLYFCSRYSSGGTNQNRVYINDPSASEMEQTEFYKYPDAGAKTNPESLGTPDGGATVPALDALEFLTSGIRHRTHHGELQDMRFAIETLAPYYENAATGNAYTLTQDADNIFNVAILSGQYDWTTPGELPGQMCKATDMSDIDLVLTQLEGSDLA